MTEIEIAMMHYDGDGSKPYCDLVHEALKEKRDRENGKGCFICSEKLNNGCFPTLEDEDVKLYLSKYFPFKRTEGGTNLNVELPIICYCPYCGRKLEQRTNNESEGKI